MKSTSDYTRNTSYRSSSPASLFGGFTYSPRFELKKSEINLKY